MPENILHVYLAENIKTLWDIRLKSEERSCEMIKETVTNDWLKV